MASRPTRKPTIGLPDLIRHKTAEAEFFLEHLKGHRAKRNQPDKPPPEEFLYNLSAFLSSAYSVGNLIKRKRNRWWQQLNNQDWALHR